MSDKAVLIVEDSKLAAIGAKAQVKALGFTPVHVMTGEEAIALYQQQGFLFILMDIGLGDGLDGAQTTQKIRKLEEAAGKARCPIIAVTSHVEGENEYYERMGLDMIIEKPLLPEHLTEIIAKFKLD